ncbi:phage tail assembly protein [Novosphingobium sp. SG720]|uniref:phage tail assembly protein n=1 Tax=Novosphingobium sp. SG720 TaxID=2586998 RepID=UPI0014480965|nr:phage tail assembly protein [Novosphingobium sp. SG720]NKJ40814.1 hypothetical protein [Novosphingobium sp. SG720]
MTDTTTTPAPAPASTSVVVTLAQPLMREGGPITSLTIRKPKGGDMRGTKLTEIVNGDVTAVAIVIPRITTPAIAAHEYFSLEADDLAEVVGVVVGFFMSSAQKALIQEMMGH